MSILTDSLKCTMLNLNEAYIVTVEEKGKGIGNGIVCATGP